MVNQETIFLKYALINHEVSINLRSLEKTRACSSAG